MPACDVAVCGLLSLNDKAASGWASHVFVRHGLSGTPVGADDDTVDKSVIANDCVSADFGWALRVT